MGLFSGILGGLGGIVGDVIGAASSAKAVKKASGAQVAALQQGLQTAQQTYSPFLNAGNSALQEWLRLSGLGDANTGISVNGNPAYSAAEQQAGAIDTLQRSPLYQRQYQNGVDTILQNAAATGGLRGGNTQRGLADFGADLLANTYQSQLGTLSGAASGFGLSSASGISNAALGIAPQIGSAQAGGILGQQGVYNNLSSNIQNTIASALAGAGGIGGVTGAGTAGSYSGGGAFPSQVPGRPYDINNLLSSLGVRF